MKKFSVIFGIYALCLMLYALPPLAAYANSPIPGPGPSIMGGGGNLTTFRGNTGAMNNNQWNSMVNPGKSAPSTAAADFGNCNSLILRCAQPKCAGCTSMDLAIPIVNGCVQSNPSCRQYGDALVHSMAAQLVSNANAKMNEAQNAAAEAAAMQAAAQGAAQMEQMQMQMQQMQMEMAQQSAQSAMAVQQALEEQKQFAAEQAAQMAVAQEAAAAASPEQRVVEAASRGVSADVIAREQISGKIMTQIENAEVAMKDLKKIMQNVFDYARCDASGNNCEGPRRVKAFKNKASQFFDPYETVLDEIYDALILAQSLGVDITEIYMMLNGSCNVWGKYMCEPCTAGQSSEGHACTNGGRTDNTGFFYEVRKIRQPDGSWKVDSKQAHCTLLNMITDQETIQQNWLDMDAGSSGGIRVACASDAIDNSKLFRNRKKQSTIDIETLRRIIEQDAPSVIRSDPTEPPKDSRRMPSAVSFCSIETDKQSAEDGIAMLQTLVLRKSLTTTGLSKVCVQQSELRTGELVLDSGTNIYSSEAECNNGRYGSEICVPIGNQWERRDPSRSRVTSTSTVGGGH